MSARSDLQSDRAVGKITRTFLTALLLALLFMVLAACGSPVEQLTATDSIPEATALTTSPTLTLTVNPSPSPTATQSPLPTKTAVPTPTSEPLPTTCFDPELQAKVEAGFLEEEGFASMEEALDELKRNPAFDTSFGWAGFENGPGWYFGLKTAVMGSSRVSLATQPENQAGDFALCMFAISPNYADKQIPLIIGVELGGKWSQTTLLRPRLSTSLSDWIELNSPEEAEEWVREVRGRFILPLILLRFDKPDWERDTLWHVGYDQILPELRRDGRYVLRYTADPSMLLAMERPGIRPSVNLLGGEFAQVDAVIDDMDPERDIGLFTFQVSIFE